MSNLEPLVAAPHSPDNRKTAHECSGTKIDRVYIGCVPAAVARQRSRCWRLRPRRRKMGLIPTVT